MDSEAGPATPRRVAPSPGTPRSVVVATLLASCVVLDVVVGHVVRNVFKLPIFLDSVGTILAGVLVGPLAGAGVGAVSNILAGALFDDPGLMPYAITAACIGAAAGGVAALGAFKSLPGAILAGLFTGLLAALVSAPISAYVAQATSSPGQVALVSVIDSTGDNLLQAITLVGILADPLDKALSFAIVYVILRLLPPVLVRPLAEVHAISRSRQLTARYGVAVGLSSVALLFAWVFRPVFGTDVFEVFYLAVVVSAWYGGLGPALLAGLVGLVAHVAFQVPPLGPGLAVDDWLRVAIYVAVAPLIVLITNRLDRTNTALTASLDEQQKQEAQTRAIVNGVVEGLVLVAPDEHLLSVNHQFEELFGVSASQVLGRSFDDLRAVVDRVFAKPDELRARVAGTTSDETARFTEIVQQVWPQERALQLFSTPVLTDGRFLGRLYGFRDVTQERELDRMKTEFVSQVSHELRTPLTAIKGFTDLLLDGDAGDVNEEQQEYLDIVKSNVDRLVALINDLLDISRIESGRIKLQLAPIDLADIIRSVAATMRPLLEGKQQTLTTVCVAPDLPPAMGDHDRVVQVVTNLLSNAHKYTQAGGSISVSAERAGDMLRVAVQDNGMGIPADDIPKLFTRFFRVDSSLTREIGGTGLGLSIVKSIVELQGGAVSVDSEPGQGSTFAFTLPLAKAPAVPAAVPSPPPPVGVSKAGTVLVVEGEADIREQFESSLVHVGYRVLVASDTAAAIAQMDRERPDLVLLRLRLTAPRGFETAQALAEATEARDIPLLVVSIQRDVAGEVASAPRLDELQVVAHVQQALEKSGARRVLIIEDDSATRKLLSTGLQNHGFEPLEAADGESGVAVAFTQAPDLVLLDLHLPGADGFDVLQQLKQSPTTARIPVIVVTGDEQLWLGARARVLALGAADFVAKPLEMDMLIEEMRTLVPWREAPRVDTSSGR